MNSALAPIYAARAAFGASVNHALNSGKNNTTASGNLTQAGAQAIWSSLGGPLLEIAYGAAIVVEVVIAIAALLTFGLSTITGVIVGLLLAIVQGLLFPALTSYVTARTAYLAEGTTNKSVGQGSNQPLWLTLADTFAWFDTGFTTTVAASDLRAALAQGAAKAGISGYFMKAEAFALGVVAAALAFAAEAGGGNEFLSIASICVAFDSVVLDLLSLKQDAKGTQNMDLLVLGLDAGAAAVSIGALVGGK